MRLTNGHKIERVGRRIGERSGVAEPIHRVLVGLSAPNLPQPIGLQHEYICVYLALINCATLSKSSNHFELH
jgi:hypothetical protein